MMNESHQQFSGLLMKIRVCQKLTFSELQSHLYLKYKAAVVTEYQILNAKCKIVESHYYKTLKPYELIDVV